MRISIYLKDEGPKVVLASPSGLRFVPRGSIQVTRLRYIPKGSGAPAVVGVADVGGCTGVGQTY